MADIFAAVTALGANPTAQQMQAAMDNVIAMSGAPPVAAVLATRALSGQANPTARGPLVQLMFAAANKVEATVVAAAATSGDPTVVAQVQAAQTVSTGTLYASVLLPAVTTDTGNANPTGLGVTGLGSAGTLTLVTTNTGSTTTVTAYIR